MSIAELQVYLLSHQTDDEAFYKFADRLESTTTDSTDLYPIPDTPENIAIMAAAIQEQIQKVAIEAPRLNKSKQWTFLCKPWI